MSENRMPVESALRHLSEIRRPRDVIISNQSSARLWPMISDHPLDFNYNPSTMGGAVPLAVGIALARPDHEIIVLSGDGSLMMSLGSLVTATASGVANLSVLLLDNGIYEVTGGQKTPATETSVRFEGVAASSGFETSEAFETLEQWTSGSRNFFGRPGPRFASLSVGPTPPQAFSAAPLSPIRQRVREWRRAIGSDA